MHYYYINYLEGSLAPAEAPVTLVFAVKQQQLQVAPCSHLQPPPAFFFCSCFACLGIVFLSCFFVSFWFAFVSSSVTPPASSFSSQCFGPCPRPPPPHTATTCPFRCDHSSFLSAFVGLQCRASKHKPSTHHNPTPFISCILQHKPHAPNPIPKHKPEAPNILPGNF